MEISLFIGIQIFLYEIYNMGTGYNFHKPLHLKLQYAVGNKLRSTLGRSVNITSFEIQLILVKIIGYIIF